MTSQLVSYNSVLRLRDVVRRVGLARATIYRMIKIGEFPAPVALGKRARGWHEAAVSQWIASRKVSETPSAF